MPTEIKKHNRSFINSKQNKISILFFLFTLTFIVIMLVLNTQIWYKEHNMLGSYKESLPKNTGNIIRKDF